MDTNEYSALEREANDLSEWKGWVYIALGVGTVLVAGAGLNALVQDAATRVPGPREERIVFSDRLEYGFDRFNDAVSRAFEQYGP